MSDAAETAVEAPAADVKNSTAETDGGDEIAAALAAVEAANADEPANGAEPKPADKVETKDDAEKKDEKEPEGPAAKGWAAVRRVEQRLQRQKKEVEATAQRMNEQAKQLEERMSAIAQREAELDSDPVAFLSKKGLSFDDLAKRYLNNGQATPEEAAKRAAAQQGDAVKQQEERLARLEAAIERREAESRIGEYRSEIKSTLAADEFEVLRAWEDAEAEVFQFADNWARKHNEVLTPRDAALKLQEGLRQQLKKLSSHQAVRSLLAGAGDGATKQVVSGQGQVPRGTTGSSPKTLTNHLAATPATGEPDFDSLSEEEQIQAVLRLT